MGLVGGKDGAGWRASHQGMLAWNWQMVTTGQDGGHQGISTWKLESTSGRDKRMRQVLAHESMELDDSVGVHTMLARLRWPTREGK